MDDDTDKMSKLFPITSLCRNDIIQMIEDNNDNDELQKTVMIRVIKKITDGQMKAIASNLSDNFCDCCFWDSLKYQFNNVIRGEYDKYTR